MSDFLGLCKDKLIQVAKDTSMHTGVALLAKVKEYEKELDHPKLKESSLIDEEKKKKERKEMLKMKIAALRKSIKEGRDRHWQAYFSGMGQGKMGGFRYLPSFGAEVYKTFNILDVCNRSALLQLVLMVDSGLQERKFTFPQAYALFLLGEAEEHDLDYARADATSLVVHYQIEKTTHQPAVDEQRRRR